MTGHFALRRANHPTDRIANVPSGEGTRTDTMPQLILELRTVLATIVPSGEACPNGRGVSGAKSLRRLVGWTIRQAQVRRPSPTTAARTASATT